MCCSLLCHEGFFSPGSPVFLPPQKPTCDLVGCCMLSMQNAIVVVRVERTKSDGREV